VARRKRSELRPTGEEQGPGTNQKGVDALLNHACECRIDFTISLGSKDFDLPAKGRNRRLCVCYHRSNSTLIVRIDEYGKALGCRQELVQKSDPLRGKLGVDERDPGNVASWPIEAGNETGLNWVIADEEDDWNRRGRGFGSRHRDGPPRRRR
jgi:hypothetical protein